MVSFDSNWEWIDGLLARGGGGDILFLGEGGDNVRFSLIFIVSIFASRSTGNAECEAVPPTCILTDLQVIAVHIKVKEAMSSSFTVLCPFSEVATHLRMETNTVLGCFRFHEVFNRRVVSAVPRVIYNNDDNEHLCTTISSDSWACCSRKKRGCGRLPWPRRAQAASWSLGGAVAFPSPSAGGQ